MEIFQSIIILLLLFILGVGYFWFRRVSQNFNRQLYETAAQKELVRKLENELKDSQGKNLEYQEEISRLKASLNNLKLKGESPEDLAPSARSEEKDLIEEDVIDNGTIPETGKEQQQRSSRRSSKFEALKNDNLQIVEGIGPKMESVLKDNGVQNWSQLGSQTETSIRTILENYGNKYKIIDPTSWPEQAQIASQRQWSKLVSMQKGLYGGSATNQINTQAKIEKVMVKLGILKMYKQDDLKAIEGIGPKIATLLNKAGINLWHDLAQTSESTLQAILDKAGKRYQLADPSSWPKQARLAEEGKFEELADYQDVLIGGS